MKIAYLHGLESSIDKKDPKIIFMNSAFDEVYAPNINYRDSSTFNKLLNDIKKLQPDLIVGSSMGGYVSYIIGSKLSIPTLLFNPAMVGRSFDPTVDISQMKGTSNVVYFGKDDTVINGESVRKYFKNEGVGTFNYKSYNGEHRVPVNIFIAAIKKITKINEIYNTTKHIKLYEEFLNESFNDSKAQDVMTEILKTLHSFSNKIKFKTEEVNGYTNIVYDDPNSITEDCLKRLKDRNFWNTDFATTVGKFGGSRVNIAFNKKMQDLLNIKDFDNLDWSLKK